MDKYTIAPPAGSTNNGIGAEDRPWKSGHFDALKLGGGDVASYLAESTGYGIVSGCEPTISGLTVTVGAGVVHLADGTRKEIASTNITLDAADSTNPRIDLVYITSAGEVAKVTGTAAASPVVPALPSQGISVATVSVVANASAGTVTDTRGMLARWYNTGVVNVKDFGAVGDGVTDDTAAIQAAIDFAESVEPNHIPTDQEHMLTKHTGKYSTIFFPAGDYVISSTIFISKPHISLIGVEYPIIYMLEPAYQEIGGSTIRRSSNFSGEAMVKITAIDFIAVNIHLIGLNRSPRDDHSLTDGFSSTSGQLQFIKCVVYGCCFGFNVIGGLTVLDRSASLYNLVGVIIGGDSSINSCYIALNGCQLAGGNMYTSLGCWNYYDTHRDSWSARTDGVFLSYSYGAGVIVNQGGAGTLIQNSQIEWNKVGIFNYSAAATQIEGNRCEYNVIAHVYIHVKGPGSTSSLAGCRGINIVGNNFFAGGNLIPGSPSNYSLADSYSHIVITGTDNTQSNYVNICGNTFKRGEASPSHDSENVPETNVTAGPKNYAVYAVTDSKLKVNTTGNDLLFATFNNTYKARNWSSNPVIIYSNGDMRNNELPNIGQVIENGTVIGTNAPTTIPLFIGETYIDTTNKKVYKAIGISASTDWIVLN